MPVGEGRVKAGEVEERVVVVRIAIVGSLVVLGAASSLNGRAAGCSDWRAEAKELGK